MAINSVDIEQYIEIGEISQFLASDSISKSSIFGNPYPVPDLPKHIRCARLAVVFDYEHANFSQDLQSVVHYMYSLCQPYAQRARTILDNEAGITVTPALPNGNYFVQQRQYPQFLVGAVGSPMNEGDTTLVITDTDITPETSDAEVEVHREGIELGENFSGRSDFTATFAPSQYTIIFDPPVTGDGNPTTSELISIKYPVRRNLTYAPNTSTSFTCILNGAETKRLEDSNGNIFQIPFGTTGVLTFTLFCIGNVTGDIYVMTWEGSANNIAGTVTVYEVERRDINIAMTLDVSVVANSADGGVEVDITGIAGKIINCRATFGYISENV